MVQNFTSEQLQNPENLVEFLELLCCLPGSSRESQITAVCWDLAHVYQSLFNTIQHPQEEKNNSGSDDNATHLAAAVVDSVTSPVSATGTTTVS